MIGFFLFSFFYVQLTGASDRLPVIQSSYESTPIPAGTESTDDAAIWLHPTTPEQSLVVGVSKNKLKDGGLPGIATYQLDGRQKEYFYHDRLNNVDLRYQYKLGNQIVDLVAASNRDKKAISIFSIDESGLKLLADLPILGFNGQLINEEPYGFCLGQDKLSRRTFAYSPMKSGLVYHHEIVFKQQKLSIKLLNVFDTSSFLSAEQNKHLMDITIREVIFEGAPTQEELAQELLDKIEDRFQLEACVHDDESETLYIGMENLGVWKLSPFKTEKPQLIAHVLKAKSEPYSDQFPDQTPRVTNDIEGLALLHGPDGKGALAVSVQGIDEYAFFDRSSSEYLGSFKLSHHPLDPVTQTDGVSLLSAPMGPEFPNGLFVVHDHLNTDEQGRVLRANYKFVSLDNILNYFPELRFEGYHYNPRQ